MMTVTTTTMRFDATEKRRLDRRTVLGGATAAVATGLIAHSGLASPAAAPEASPATVEGGRATFVLVHGAWAGAWIWRDLIRQLRNAGHDVYAVTLTGLGDRAHLVDSAIDLDTHITDVVNVLETEELRDVTLVGWSSGGMVITGVAEQVPERLAQLVYFDASVPTDGQNDYDASIVFDDVRQGAIAADIADGMAAGLPGLRPVSPGIEEWIRGALKDPAAADWVLGKLVPQPLLTLQQPVRLGNPVAAALPRVFVLFTADKDLAVEPQMDASVLAAERVQSDPNWRLVELADNHLGPVNNPRMVAEALLTLV